jgi:hypothetical protein
MTALLQPRRAAMEELVRSSLDEMDRGEDRRTLRRLAQAWAEGRLDELETYPQWCECVNTPLEKAMMRRLLNDRNGPMADKIARLHRGEGALRGRGQPAHGGPQGLPALLAARGFTVTRVRWPSPAPAAVPAPLPAQNRPRPPPRPALPRSCSVSESSPFPALMPGFDFLQGLVRQAGTALPGMNAWITPTLDPEELDKRISELRTVQFWLEQNARLLGTTIQGLEVQRMTLNTLRSMNVSMGDLREAMAIRATPEPSRACARTRPRAPGPAPRPSGPAGTEGEAAPGLVDPMQWWGTLTQQFGQIAAQALKDAPATVQAMAQASQAAPAPPPRPTGRASPARGAAVGARKPRPRPPPRPPPSGTAPARRPRAAAKKAAPR